MFLFLKDNVDDNFHISISSFTVLMCVTAHQ